MYRDYRPQPVSVAAKQMLSLAAARLNTANPVHAIGEVIDASLGFPPGHQAARRKRLLEPTYNETTPNTLALVMDPGEAGANGRDRVEGAVQTMRRLVATNFGREALRWADGRLAPVVDGGPRTLSWGASLGTGFDRGGLTESYVACEWGPGLMDALPNPLYQLARVAVEALPGLRPSLSTIRCGRSSGSQQITFEVDAALPLANLQPLMEALGLGHQHGSLMSACAFMLGARFTLPPNTAAITLRPTRTGVELRLDVDLEALPDVPPQLASLLRLQLAERPSSLRTLDRWLMALTPDGYPGPGNMTVLSVWVRPDTPARVALYLRPAALDTPAEAGAPANGTVSAPPALAPANGAAPAQAPAAASAYWG